MSPLPSPLLLQEELSLEYATFEGLPPVGAVPPNSEHRVKVRLTTERLGSFRIPLQVRDYYCSIHNL